MKVVIIGAGVIGLSCAWYASKKGFEVTVLDSGDGTDNCSWGNAGYISPSHFVPLASPGIVAQGLRWMLSPTSPFYIRLKADAALARWCWTFYRKANATVVARNAPHLNQLLGLSRQLIEDIARELPVSVGLQTKGCLMLYKKETTGHHEAELAREARMLGWSAEVLSAAEVQAMEPDVRVDVLGGVYFPQDAHLHPGSLMQALRQDLVAGGVTFLSSNEVTGFDISKGKVEAVNTGESRLTCDAVVLATGSRLAHLAAGLGLSLLVQPGKGYSMTFGDQKSRLYHPAILVDDRVAMTPLGADLRVGGTMELGNDDGSINMRRVRPIVQAANTYYPELYLSVPGPEDVWHGLRPCTPDGLPYLGKVPHLQNAVVAGGHAMIGISMAAGTGLLVSQMLAGEKTEIPVDGFRVDRF